MGEAKRRRKPAGDTGSFDSVPLLAKAYSQTVTLIDIAEWQKDNEFIFSGYRRPQKDYYAIYQSLFYMHNETCNIYSHLIGALILPLVAVTTVHYMGSARFFDVMPMDYYLFGFFFGCTEICLILSTLFHLLGCHSHPVEEFWHGMDMLGIIICTVGTFTAGINYVFWCEEHVQYLHWGINWCLGTLCSILISFPALKTPKWRPLKVGAFFCFGASSLIPIVHGTSRYGSDFMLKHAGMSGYLGEMACYGTGVFLYAFRIPERFAPGKFDLVGGSHNLFHILILGAMACHLSALLQGFASVHTLDVCLMKGVKAG